MLVQTQDCIAPRVEDFLRATMCVRVVQVRQSAQGRGEGKVVDAHKGSVQEHWGRGKGRQPLSVDEVQGQACEGHPRAVQYLIKRTLQNTTPGRACNA